MSPPASDSGHISTRDRYLVLAAGFLGWMFAGMEMGVMPLVSRAVSKDLLGAQFNDALAGQWFAWYNVAFLLGGALGGFAFGGLGDKVGRVKALGWSILCYASFTGAGYFVWTQEQLLVLRFIASVGIGGVWPNCVSLVSEFWARASRPMVAGVLGTSANIGVLFMGLIGQQLEVTPETWRAIMVVGTAPVLLGIMVLVGVPESVQWLSARSAAQPAQDPLPATGVFRPPLLRLTLIGICLSTIPLFGAWGAGKWLIPWADVFNRELGPGFKAATQAIWAGGAALGSFFGGRLANLLGRRLTYFLISLGALAANGGIYRFMSPQDGWFLPGVFVLGFVSTIFFGWLPLYLPELFPTRVRATGSGVSYNFGRLASAAGVLCSGALMHHFGGDYARIGAVTSLIYALGLVVIWWAPDTTRKGLAD